MPETTDSTSDPLDVLFVDMPVQLVPAGKEYVLTHVRWKDGTAECPPSEPSYTTICICSSGKAAKAYIEQFLEQPASRFHEHASSAVWVDSEGFSNRIDAERVGRWEAINDDR